MSIGNKPRLLSVSSVQKTEPESFEKINEEVMRGLAKDFKTGFVYWQSADHVTFGLYESKENGCLLFAEYSPEWKHLQELRVFNNESELRIWRDRKTYHGRVITDNKDAPEDKYGNCLEQEVKLWGTSAEKSSDRFIILAEDRGMRLALPVRWEDRFKKDIKGINAFLKERLYLKENDETGCVYIYDRRFCGLHVADENGELKEVTL